MSRIYSIFYSTAQCLGLSILLCKITITISGKKNKINNNIYIYISLNMRRIRFTLVA